LGPSFIIHKCSITLGKSGYRNDDLGFFSGAIKQELKDGIILVAAGLQGMEAMSWSDWVRMEKVEGENKS